MVGEFLTHRRRECVVAISESEVQAVRRADVTRTGLRLYQDGCIGVAGCLGEATREELEPAARESLEAGVPYPCEPAGELVQSEHLAAELEDPEELVAEVEAILAALRAEQPGLLFSNQAAVFQEERRMRNDRGLDLHHQGSGLGLGLIFKERGSPYIVDGILGHAGRTYDREAFLGWCREYCEAYHRRVELPAAGTVPVIVAPGAGLSQPLDWFARYLNGRAFGTGASPLVSRRDQQAFHRDFELLQSRHPDDGLQPFFDAEGVAHEGHRYPLVRAGVIEAPYTDRRTAARYELPHTGAACGDHDGVPGLAAPTLGARPGERTLAELLEGRPAVLVDIASGGDSTPEGDYSSPVQLAFLHDGERLLGRLPELSIRGNLYRMLGEGFRGVSADCHPSFSTEHKLVVEMEVARL